jgi:hypothetical protein
MLVVHSKRRSRREDVAYVSHRGIRERAVRKGIKEAVQGVCGAMDRRRGVIEFTIHDERAAFLKRVGKSRADEMYLRTDTGQAMRHHQEPRC